VVILANIVIMVCVALAASPKMRAGLDIVPALLTLPIAILLVSAYLAMSAASREIAADPQSRPRRKPGTATR
jgi:hypothetical protein